MDNFEYWEIPRPPDGEAHYLHCTGGFRACQMDEDKWGIEPVLEAGKICQKATFTRREVEKFIDLNKIIPVAIQHIYWKNGKYYSRWVPIISDRNNHFRGPVELWSSISANIRNYRLKSDTENHRDLHGILKDFDHQTDVERLSHSISICLEGMNFCIEQISEFYNEQLVNMLRDGKHESGINSFTFHSHILYANVHGFFLHFGTARDYLANLISIRIDKIIRKDGRGKIDSLNELLKAIDSKDIYNDSILQIMHSSGILSYNNINNLYSHSGWLKHASKLRNIFVHKRPYGQKLSENTGHLILTSRENKIWKYYRPLLIEAGKELDIFDEITYLYRKIILFFQRAAEKSGYDAQMITLNSSDIISSDFHPLPR